MDRLRAWRSYQSKRTKQVELASKRWKNAELHAARQTWRQATGLLPVPLFGSCLQFSCLALLLDTLQLVNVSIACSTQGEAEEGCGGSDAVMVVDWAVQGDARPQNACSVAQGDQSTIINPQARYLCLSQHHSARSYLSHSIDQHDLLYVQMRVGMLGRATRAVHKVQCGVAWKSIKAASLSNSATMSRWDVARKLWQAAAAKRAIHSLREQNRQVCCGLEQRDYLWCTACFCGFALCGSRDHLCASGSLCGCSFCCACTCSDSLATGVKLVFRNHNAREFRASQGNALLEECRQRRCWCAEQDKECSCTVEAAEHHTGNTLLHSLASLVCSQLLGVCLLISPNYQLF